jgi:hypothetical protein
VTQGAGALFGAYCPGLSRFPRFLGTFATLLALGCASEPTDLGGDAGSASGGSAGSGGKGNGAAPARCPEGPNPSTTTEAVVVEQVSAALVDEQGESVTAGLAQVCGKDVCYDVVVDRDGLLDKTVNAPMDAPAVKVGDGRAWGKLAFPIGEGSTDLGTVTVTALPAFAEGAALSAGESVASGGVTLQLAEDAHVEIDTLSYEEESEWGFRAAALSAASLAELEQGFVMAFTLAPLETVICPAPALSIENSAELAPGTELELFVLGLDVLEEWAGYAGWEKVGEGQVSDDGATLEFPDGVPVLTAIGIREKS